MAVTRDLWIVLRARDEASRIVRSFGNNMVGSTNRMAANMSQFDQTVQNVAQRLNQFAMTSMLAGSVMTAFGAAGLHMLHSMVKVAAEYDRQVRHTMTQVDGITVSMEQLAQVGRNVARDVAIPFEQMQETLFFIFSSMNVTLEESERLLRGFAKEAVAGQTTVEAAARTTIAILNALNLTTEDLTRIQDVQFQVVRKGIITYEELANVVGRALPATARAGQSFETLGAMIAFLTRNGLSAAMAATSAARAMESFAHPVTVKRLEAMGIAVRNARGEFLPLVDVMEQMNKKISKLSSPERAKFLQELFVGAGGTIQARRFWDVAFKNFGDFEEMIGFMANSTGVFQSAYETMAGSVAAKTELLRNKWMLIKEAIGRALLPHFLKLLGVLERVLGWFDRLPEPVKAMVGQFIFWASIIGVVTGVLTILVGTLAFFVSGIMMAGTALVAVLATIILVTSAFMAFAVAIGVAWNQSKGFRDTLKQMAAIASEIWAILSSGAREIAKEFNDRLQPSLAKLWDIIQTKVVPAVQKFLAIWREELLPKLQEAKNIIVDFVENSLDYIAKVIDDTVIPAVEKLTEWWEKNSDSVRPFMKVAAQIIKWLLIIGAVLLGLPFLTVITLIGTFILATAAIIFALKKVWEWIVKAGGAVKSFFESIGLFLQSVVNKIGQIVQAGLNFIYNNIWMPIWNMFGGLIKEIFGFIFDIINYWTTLIKEVIKDWLIPIWEFAKAVWGNILDFIVFVWNKIKDAIAKALFIIYTVIIKPVLDTITRVWREYLSGLWDWVKNIWDKIVAFYSGIFDKIKSFFAGSGSWLLNAGKDIIQGLIDGITEKVKDLRKKLREITDEIPKWKGPRAVDMKLLFPTGTFIMKGFIQGLRSQMPMLARELGGITNQIGQLPSPTMTVPNFQTPTATTDQRTFNQYFTITTQEIDPRVHSMELGFDLANRL